MLLSLCCAPCCAPKAVSAAGLEDCERMGKPLCVQVKSFRRAEPTSRVFCPFLSHRWEIPAAGAFGSVEGVSWLKATLSAHAQRRVAELLTIHGAASAERSCRHSSFQPCCPGLPVRREGAPSWPGEV